MRVRCLYFASLEAVAGTSEQELELEEGATVGDLIRLLERLHPRLAHSRGYRVAVDEDLAEASQVLASGAEVALLPPVSGGSSGNFVRLTREPISVDDCLSAVRREDCGAVVLFLGTVRDRAEGKPVERLEYTAYAGMAFKELEKLACAARDRFRLGGVAVWHRIGHLPPGEISVAVAVSAPHRQEAFEAGRWTIDTLKSTVPLWKREVGPEGAVWIEGDARTPG
ncbi:MAG: molybdenum cofactor biosynthesis protein MoaE [Armatimonadetes bacterium]|nr:molybdenum cofactor biosynthesis protein MoaE [Armatimonadota bacterium]